MRVIRRARQFFAALEAKLSKDDDEYVCRNLDADERRLFFAMSEVDQCHAVRVARTAEMLSRGQKVDCALLTRAALLHDVGRVRGDMGITGKVFAVLMDGLLPKFSRRAAKKDGGFLRRILFVYYDHAAVGAEKLRGIGRDEIASLTEKHHAPPSENDAAELILLRRADEMN